MENWEEEFSDQFFVSTEGRNDIRMEKIKKLILQIRQDTLRQVLPVIKTHKEGEGDYCDTGEDMDWACRSNCVELAVERLINKAKELWGIELNNLK